MATKAFMERHSSVVVDKSVRIRCLSHHAELELTHEDGTPIPPESLEWTRPARVAKKKTGRSFED
jgi:hypothetical protein